MSPEYNETRGKRTNIAVPGRPPPQSLLQQQLVIRFFGFLRREGQSIVYLRNPPILTNPHTRLKVSLSNGTTPLPRRGLSFGRRSELQPNHFWLRNLFGIIITGFDRVAPLPIGAFSHALARPRHNFLSLLCMIVFSYRRHRASAIQGGYGNVSIRTQNKTRLDVRDLLGSFPKLWLLAPPGRQGTR